jgi:F-type H+-transporting ATPase subunit b
MDLTIIAAAVPASGGPLDLLKDTADTFGWNLWLFLSQVISFVVVAAVLRKFAYQPILKVLQERRDRIAEGLRAAEKSKQELAEAEKKRSEILAKANAEAQGMIEEAREAAAHVAERKEQESILAAEQIIAKAREASKLEHERIMSELKRELGRLVVETTAKVTGKVLAPEDRRRLQEEAARQLAA